VSTATPQAEFEIEAALVKELLATQHPDLATLPLQLFEAGWDNMMFRLGDALALRLPRREAAAPLILNEQRWLPELAPGLPLGVPAPLRIGEPGCGYPCYWSVQPWFPGEPADLELPRADQGAVLGDFLRTLHQPAPPDAPTNEFRGVPLQDRAPVMTQRLEHLRLTSDVITDEIEAGWAEALAAAPFEEPVWLHGDLHPRNVLADGGALVAAIDWGDITSGDPATDLAAIWMLLPEASARREAWLHYGAGDVDLVARSRGWAISFASMLCALDDDPRHVAVAEHTFQRLIADMG
jgi:aminoglycoside phosphotransferase (APT) family kinase protein